MPIVMNIMLSRDLGGIQQAFLDYNTALRRQNCSVINVVSRGAEVIKSSAIENAHQIINLGPIDFISKIQLGRIFNEYKPDVVIAHGNRAMSFSRSIKAKGAPIVGVAHNYSIKGLKKCDYVIAITEHLASFLVENGFDKNKVILTPNMIDITQERAAPRNSQDILVIGAMGRFVKKKGFDNFLHSLSLLKGRGVKFKAVIGGSGEEEDRLKQLCIKLQLENVVDFIGWVENKKNFFDQVDIFCLPSRHEPFGIILLEAMSYKKPVLSTRSEGPSEIIKNGRNGLLCLVDRPDDMATKLKKLLLDRDYATKLGENGYLSLMANYEMDLVGKKLVMNLQRIINEFKSH
jgi:glycosyltransferase involved in cell wall biosynthesis